MAGTLNAHPPAGHGRWLIVANPLSGGGRILHNRQKIETALRGWGIEYEFAVSEYPGHAVDLTARAVESGCRRILAVGGDGTVSECANGLFRQQAAAPDSILLGALPAGTGNDWARTLGVPKDPEQVASCMAAGASRLQDVGVATFDDGRTRHFINVAGLGLDAHVVQALPARRPGRAQRLGKLAYLFGLARGLFTYRAVSLGLTFARHRIDTRALVLFCAIGRYCGNGMNVAPAARPDDGLFDITLVQELSRWELVRNLRRLFDGTLPGHPKVITLREASLRVDTAGLPVEADGELIGAAPVHFSLLPGALRVLAPGE